MKKNKMMRLASAMMVLTLMSTSVISGTFAKYVTSDSATDTARVAKWGVTVTAETTDDDTVLFSEAYETDETGADAFAGNSVVSSTTDMLVAPGTKNETGITFTITGSPEVAVNLVIDVDDSEGSDAKTESDVFLKAGTYADMTTGNDEDTFKFTGDDYYPVVFTLKNGAGTVLETGKLSDIATYLEGMSGKYAAGSNLAYDLTDAGNNTLAEIDGTYTLTWDWTYGNTSNVTLDDKKDTLLGNLSVNANLAAKNDGNAFTSLELGNDYNNIIDFKITVSVTQID